MYSCGVFRHLRYNWVSLGDNRYWYRQGQPINSRMEVRAILHIRPYPGLKRTRRIEEFSLGKYELLSFLAKIVLKK